MIGGRYKIGRVKRRGLRRDLKRPLLVRLLINIPCIVAHSGLARTFEFLP